MTLADWLLVQIEADEKIARAATPGDWFAGDANEGTDYRPLWTVTNDAFHNPPRDDSPWLAVELHTGVRADVEHIATHDPARILAECAAKRALIEHGVEVWILRILAQPYADREGWRTEWATPKTAH
jgi:hypothetical protein